MCSRQIALLFAVLAVLVTVWARPDSAGHLPLPGPGIAYGGIPYGSMSGNVAEYYKRQAPSIARTSSLTVYPHHGIKVDFTPIEQWLR